VLSDVFAVIRVVFFIMYVVDTAASFNGLDQAVVAHAVVSMQQFSMVALQM